jgi:hypothetical protein
VVVRRALKVHSTDHVFRRDRIKLLLKLEPDAKGAIDGGGVSLHKTPTPVLVTAEAESQYPG